MSENFTIEIISPENSIIKSSTTEVVIPSYEGEMGILKDHVPLITFLRPGVITIINVADKKKFFHIILIYTIFITNIERIINL